VFVNGVDGAEVRGFTATGAPVRFAYTEIAKREHTSQRTVERQLMRAKRKLRQDLTRGRAAAARDTSHPLPSPPPDQAAARHVACGRRRHRAAQGGELSPRSGSVEHETSTHHVSAADRRRGQPPSVSSSPTSYTGAQQARARELADALADAKASRCTAPTPAW